MAKSAVRIDHSGSSFDSFLDEQGVREEVEAVAHDRVLAWQVQADAEKTSGTNPLHHKRLASVVYKT